MTRFNAPSQSHFKALRPALTFLVSTALFSACLTLNVNVNFPESAVQEATDSYVHDLYRAKEKGRPAKKVADPSADPAPGASAKPSAKSTLHNHWSLEHTFSSLVASLELIPAAQAADANVQQFHIDSPKAVKIREKLASWIDEVIAQKKAGVVGEGQDGKLVIRSPEQIKPLLKGKIEKLVADENQLRDELYAEVVKSNHMSSDRIQDVRKNFARSFQAESPAGTYIEEKAGVWTKK